MRFRFRPPANSPYFLHGLFGILSIYWALRIYYVPWEKVDHLIKIENVDIDCDPVYKGSEDERVIRKIKFWNYHFNYIEHELKTSENICKTINKYFNFPKQPNSVEERDFPLAYGMVVYHNVTQILLQLSIFYQPQHLFCMNIDWDADVDVKNTLKKIPKCFSNVNVNIGTKSQWGTFGILKNVYSCFHSLASANHSWKYYQYLAGTDIPMRTNLEMVRIFKAMNGSINSDIDEYEIDRKKSRDFIEPPIPMFKSSMSVAMPRQAANYVINSRKVERFLMFLKKTWVADESFWTSVSGSPQYLQVPGAFKAKDVIWFRKNFRLPEQTQFSVNNVGTSYIGRYQLWVWHRKCMGYVKNWSCVFGVDDVEEMITRPELVAHKFYISFQPAGLICMIKEIRRRSADPKHHKFSAKSYSEMPTVEMSSGKSIMELTHPEWLAHNSFYNPDQHPLDNLKII